MVLADDARGYRRDQSGPERVGDADRIPPRNYPVIAIPALSAADPRYLRLAFGERASKYCLNPGRRSVSNEVNAVPAQTPRTTGRYPRPPYGPGSRPPARRRQHRPGQDTSGIRDLLPATPQCLVTEARVHQRRASWSELLPGTPLLRFSRRTAACHAIQPKIAPTMPPPIAQRKTPAIVKGQKATASATPFMVCSIWISTYPSAAVMPRRTPEEI